MKIISKKNQSGITLIMSLVMLLVMTIIGVTAMKISSVDLLIANNYQQQLSVYQEAETKIGKEVSLYRLYDWIMDDRQPPITTKDSLTVKAEVADLDHMYPCKGQSSLANSLGPNSPKCKLFLFKVDADLKGSGAKESHFKGAGKQFPNQTNGSSH